MLGRFVGFFTPSGLRTATTACGGDGSSPNRTLVVEPVECVLDVPSDRGGSAARRPVAVPRGELGPEDVNSKEADPDVDLFPGHALS